MADFRKIKRVILKKTKNYRAAVGILVLFIVGLLIYGREAKISSMLSPASIVSEDTNVSSGPNIKPPYSIEVDKVRRVKTYVNPVDGYQFDYPIEWIECFDVNGRLYRIYPPSEISADEALTCPWLENHIQIAPGPKGLETYRTDRKEQTVIGGREWKIFYLIGRTGSSSTLEFSEENGNRRIVLADYAPRDGWLTLELYYQLENEKMLIKVFETITSSFVFLEE